MACPQNGINAVNIDKRRPETIIFAFTPHEAVQRQMLLSWRVIPIHLPIIHTIDEMIQKVYRKLCENKYVQPGDIILIVAGAPIGEQGTTNMLTLHKIEDHSSN